MTGQQEQGWGQWLQQPEGAAASKAARKLVQVLCHPGPTACPEPGPSGTKGATTGWTKSLGRSGLAHKSYSAHLCFRRIERNAINYGRLITEVRKSESTKMKQ